MSSGHSSSNSDSPSSYLLFPAIPNHSTRRATDHSPSHTSHLAPLVLVSTLDGNLHALNRESGTWNWTLSDPSRTDFPLPIIDHERGHMISHSDTSDNHPPGEPPEFYALEPRNDGDIYVFSKHSSNHSGSSRLEKLPISVSQLVNLSPFTFQTGGHSRMFIGSKQTHILALDLRTGSLLKVLDHPSPNSHSKTAPSNPDPADPSRSHFPSDLGPQCSARPQITLASSNPTHPDGHSVPNDLPIEHRPQDLLYIGRTDYQVSIYSQPHKLLQTLRYSTFSPSNPPHTSPQFTWTKTPDGLYLEPTHDGHLVCFQSATHSSSSEPSKTEEQQKIKWQISFDHPVNAIFDIAFPSPSHTSESSNSHPFSAQHDQHLSDQENHQSLAAHSLPPHHPMLFVQPKLPQSCSAPASHSQHSASASEQFRLFSGLRSKSSSLPPNPNSHSSPLAAQDAAFLGKFKHSFFIMSRNHYPLVALAPSAIPLPGSAPEIGIHLLAKSSPDHPLYFPPSFNTRLLDPGILLSPQSEPRPHPAPLALDPSPRPPLLPPASLHPPQLELRIPEQSSNSVTSQTPLQLQQKAAEISSLIVRTIRDQLIPNGDARGHQPHQTGSDERSLAANPVVTILFVLVVMSWWASRKVGPQSSNRWNQFCRLATQSHPSKPDGSSAYSREEKLVGRTADKQPSTSNPSQEPERPVLLTAPVLVKGESTAHSARDDLASHQLLQPLGADLIGKAQKPKRRRGKRPGQKAAARAEAAAKAEVDAASKATCFGISTAMPVAAPVVGSSERAEMGPQPLVSDLPRPVKVQKPSNGLKKKQPCIDAVKSQKDMTHIRSSSFSSTSTSTSSSSSSSPGTDKACKSMKPRKPRSKLNVQFVHTSCAVFEESGVERRCSSRIQPLQVGSLTVTDETIGYGSHGTVVLKGRFQGRQVAVKRLLKDFVTIAMHEVGLLQESDDHPNVIRYFAKESVDNFMYIGLELCNGSLFDLIEGRDFDGSQELRKVFNPKKALKQVTSGLGYLHKLKIVHRDIKPQNILISLSRSRIPQKARSEPIADPKRKVVMTASFRMLISDFGLCKKLEIDESSFAQTTNNAAGSFGYRAPEILQGQVNVNEPASLTGCSSHTSSTLAKDGQHGTSKHRLTRSIDIFSLGCIYYYVLSKGDHPFGSRFEREVKILRGQASLKQLDGFDDEESFEAKDLIGLMISLDPKERPSAEAILQYPYFWGPSRRLMFLCDCSDRFEIMERDQTTELMPGNATIAGGSKTEGALNELEKVYVRRRSENGPNVHFDWYRKLDRVLIDNLGKYRRYDGHSVRDLLRVLRNKKHHYQDLSDGLKKTLGDLPEGFLKYFEGRFPWLMLHVYKVVQRYLKQEMLFKTNYFEFLEDDG